MLPPELPGHAKGKCCLLKKHMYDTRAAANECHQECSSFLKAIGVAQWVASPSIFVHSARNVATIVHGER